MDNSITAVSALTVQSRSDIFDAQGCAEEHEDCISDSSSVESDSSRVSAKQSGNAQNNVKRIDQLFSKIKSKKFFSAFKGKKLCPSKDSQSYFVFFDNVTCNVAMHAGTHAYDGSDVASETVHTDDESDVDDVVRADSYDVCVNDQSISMTSNVNKVNEGMSANLVNLAEPVIGQPDIDQPERISNVKKTILSVVVTLCTIIIITVSVLLAVMAVIHFATFIVIGIAAVAMCIMLLVKIVSDKKSSDEKPLVTGQDERKDVLSSPSASVQQG